MSNPNEWSNDYSFFVHNIEGKLTSSLGVNQTPLQTNLNTSYSTIHSTGMETSIKRKRLSDLVLSSIDIDDDSHLVDDSKFEKYTFSTKPNHTSTKSLIAIQAENDELKLINEKLNDQLKSYKAEHDRFKEHVSRQMQFLEEKNVKLKQESEDRLKKYYDEKKKWQTKLREAQESQAAQPTSNLSVSTKSNSYSFSLNSDSSNQQDIFSNYSKLIDEKSQESKDLQIKLLQLEKENYSLTKEIKTLQSNLNVNSIEDNQQELKTLRKQYQDLEKQYKLKIQDLEKKNIKIHNQSLLEDEIHTLQTKYSLAQETIKSYNNMEIQYQILQEEKKLWQDLFLQITQYHKDYLSHASFGSPVKLAISDDSNTLHPSQVLSIFSNIQKQNLLARKQTQELELSINQLRKQLIQNQEEKGHIDHEYHQLLHEHDILKQQLAHSKRQFLFFEKEINSLRSLLKTFDFEFQIGKPAIDKLTQSKDDIISQLRQDIDNLRNELKTTSELRFSTALTTQPALIPNDASSMDVDVKEDESGDKIKSNIWKEKYENLLDDFKVLQEISGVDYVPTRTKILHLSYNPWSDLTKTTSKVETLPSDMIRELTKKNRELKIQLEELNLKYHETKKNLVARSTDNDDNDANIDEDNIIISSSTTNTSINPSTSANSLVDLQKLNTRLKEMFKEKITVFREAVYILTGFKVLKYISILFLNILFSFLN